LPILNDSETGIFGLVYTHIVYIDILYRVQAILNDSETGIFGLVYTHIVYIDILYRVQAILNDSETGIFGLGTNRSLQAYELFANISISRGEVGERARSGETP
jgi:cobalamin synthase